ncbi:hypothetical protein DL765_001104 [Monosporascus sp. GIB2]|nr:hypothetical protein DL765_001104 [Monosporascus sp. GIB2]
MKITSLTLLAAAVALAEAAPSKLPAPGESLADGLWVFATDEAGNTKVDFTPHDEIANATQLEQRSNIQKRREGCHPTVNVASTDTDIANARLLETWSDSIVTMGDHERRIYVYNNALSFICAYGAGWKSKTSISSTWYYVKSQLCGVDRLGYAQVVQGDAVGDWIAGYTFNGDKYCW